MKYKTLIIERGSRGRRFKKPVTLKVPERQTLAEKKLLRYIWESLSRRSSLIPFTFNNVSTMKLARHLLFNRTGSQPSLYNFVSHFHYFCAWIQAEPDQIVNKCLNRNGNSNSKEIATLTKKLEEYIDYSRTKNNSSSTIWRRLKAIVSVFRLNGIDIRLPYGIRAWTVYDDRAPSREEIQKVLNVADLRERVVITILAVSGLRLGTLIKLQYRHVKHDLEHGIIPIHVHVEATITKGKQRSYDTFLNEEASECLRAYIDSRKKGTRKIPPEQIRDESPIIRTDRSKEVRTVTSQGIAARIHELFVKADILENNSSRRTYEVRTHSLRKFFRTQMASLNVDRDCIDYMMGHAIKDRYHDVRMKGVEYFRGVYLTSGIRIRPKIKMNRIDALKEIIQSWGLDPQKILTCEALAQITPTEEKKQADNGDLVSELKALQPRTGSSLLEGKGA